MVDNSIALRGENPPVNALGNFQQGMDAAAGIDAAKMKNAGAAIEMIGAGASYALNEDGSVDPARYNEVLDSFEAMGVPGVERFRANPNFAKIAREASVSALARLKMAKDDRDYEMVMAKFEADMQQSDRTYELQREKFDYLKGKEGDAQSTLGKLKSDLDAGYIDQATYDAAVKKATTAGEGITISPDGTVSIGNQLGKLTEGQSKDVNYYIRGKAALDTIDANEAALISLKDNTADALPLGNYLTSKEYQQANQAGKEFLASILRKDTGAAITKQEFEIYGPMFLPKPGDGPDVLAQKKTARARAIEAIRVGLGAKGDALLPEGERPADDAAPAAPAANQKTIGGVTYEQDENGEWYEAE